jgi:hypothetical protein
MTDALEQELRSALAERATRMPPEARDRLAQLDYQPQAGPRRRPTSVWSLASAGGAAIAAATVAALLLLSSGGSTLVPLAYAGWSATPETPTAAQVARAIARCRHLAGPLLARAMRGRLILTDKRGRYVAVMYDNHGYAGVCILDEPAGAGAGGGSSPLLNRTVPPEPDQLGAPVGGGGYAPGFPGSHGSERHVSGRAGRDVLAVTLVFPGNRTVQATIEHGWYFAWWPGSDWPPASVVVTTSSGTVRSPMPGKDCQARPRVCVFTRREI